MLGVASRKRKRNQQSVELSAYRDRHFKVIMNYGISDSVSLIYFWPASVICDLCSYDKITSIVALYETIVTSIKCWIEVWQKLWSTHRGHVSSQMWTLGFEIDVNKSWPLSSTTGTHQKNRAKKFLNSAIEVLISLNK